MTVDVEHGMHADPPEGHRIQSIVAPKGLNYGGTLTCECGWYQRYDRLGAARNRHELHWRFRRVVEGVIPSLRTVH